MYLVRGFFSFAKPAMGVGFGRRMFLSLIVSELGSKAIVYALEGSAVRQPENAYEKDKRNWSDFIGSNRAVRGALSLHLSQYKSMSLSVDKAQAYIPAGTPCKEAAKSAFPTDKKARHAFKRECKQAWKAQKKAA